MLFEVFIFKVRSLGPLKDYTINIKINGGNIMGIFGNLFDFNGDGKLDALEQAMDFGLFVQMMEELDQEDETSDDTNDYFDD